MELESNPKLPIVNLQTPMSPVTLGTISIQQTPLSLIRQAKSPLIELSLVSPMRLSKRE